MENVIFDHIRREIESSDIVLYMKGTAPFPMCGFSAAIVQILSQLGVPFKDINVLEDSVLRKGLKDFSSWPSIPQLYIKGQFIGGCDIIREMYETGELHALIENHNIPMSAAA